MNTYLVFFFVVVFPGSVVVLLWASKSSRNRRYPPGPRGWPIIGNLLDVPVSYPWLTYRGWSLKYGPVVHLRVLGQSIVILNTAKAASDFLDARSANYSDRVRSVIIPLVGLDWSTGLMPYGPTWRKHRRTIHQYFTSDVIRQYQPVQLRKARQLLHHLHQDPENFLRYVHFMLKGALFAIIHQCDWGHRYGDNIWPHQAAAEVFIPGKYLIEFLPFLRHIPAWFPGAEFQRKAAKWKTQFTTMKDAPFNAARAALRTGDAKPSMVMRMLDQLTSPEDEIQVEVFKNSAGVIYGGYPLSKQTNLAMQAFFAAMVLYPDVQKIAQEELTAVVGSDRLPEFSDRESLPYVNAVVKECTRWMPVNPLGVPHASMADDEYNGYLIPKGTIVIANQWRVIFDESMAILHDGDDYPDPELFKPERFIKDGKLNREIKDPHTAAFGFGRRICPGRHFSDATMFINIASILHVFDISQWFDEIDTSLSMVCVQWAINLEQLLKEVSGQCGSGFKSTFWEDWRRRRRSFQK
ncbi:cytochrome P450 [Obba rivulosa]|uniref:Cytochrome P450 n=1 Tax=Obba rivulosa TaxID=1052685 RepID=A0A8E2ANQ3_9APHY|nr:cytochrome P450 [Obba rivulosa]